MAISEGLVREFDQEMESTRRLLACVPDGKNDWRPHAKSMALGRLAGHVAEISSWGGDVLRSDKLEITPQNRPENSRFVPGTSEELLRRFDGWVAETRATMTEAPDEKWWGNWKMSWNGHPVIDAPRLVVYRSTVMNHMIHHRGQLGVYLRLNEIAIPGMYGPSADEGF